MATLSKAYVLNHPEGNGLKRKEYISKSLEREGIDYEIIDQFHPNEIDQKEIQKNFHLEQPIWIEAPNKTYWSIPTRLSINVISTSMKHQLSWLKQLENNYDYIVVFEDDCGIPEGLGDILRKCVNEMEEDNYDMAMLGEWGNVVSSNIRENKHLHYSQYQKTRCLTGYIMSRRASELVSNFFKNIRNSPDIQMDEAIQTYNLKVAWMEPGLKSIFDSQQVHGWVE